MIQMSPVVKKRVNLIKYIQKEIYSYSFVRFNASVFIVKEIIINHKERLIFQQTSKVKSFDKNERIHTNSFANKFMRIENAKTKLLMPHTYLQLNIDVETFPSKRLINTSD